MSNAPKANEAKTTQHTPGPWTVGKRRHEGTVVEDNRNVLIATVWSSATWVDERETMPDDANARLIAQAPVMYELLRAFVDEFDESDPTRTTWTGNTPANVEDARAIIAAIEGGQP